MTAAADSNRLRNLESKIRGLPQQAELTRRRQLFRSTRDSAQACLLDLEATLQGIHTLRTLKGDLRLLHAQEEARLGTVRGKVGDLLTLLAKTDPDSQKVGVTLDVIRRAIAALKSEATAAWVQLCADHKNRADGLRPLAQTLSPSLLRRIQDVDRQLPANSAYPPTNPDAIRAILSARQALDTEIESLDMTGPVAAFLRDAQAGRGDPQALLQPAVRDFLDANPALWKVLRVVLT